MQLFELFCTIGIKDDGFESGIAKAKDNALSFGAAAKTMMAELGAAATAFGGLSVKALQLGGDLEQSIGGIQTLFKDSADAVVANAEKAYKTAGVDANNYMQQVTSLLQSLGGDTEKAVSAADMAIIDMADNANKMGSSIESIQNAYQGFAKQNYMMLDNLKLGYGGTKTEMERLLADAEKLSGVKYDISNLNDVYQAIHVIQGELGITGTTAKEAAETLTGSFGAAKAAISNFLSGAGGVGEFIGTVSNLGNIVVKNLQEILPRLTEGLPKVFAELVPVTVKLFDTLVPAVIDGALKLVEGLAKGIIDNLPLIFDSAKKITATLIEGIGDVTPIFKPILNALSFLNDNLGAVIASLITFKSVMAISAVIGTATSAIKAITTAQWSLNAAMAANPIGVVATALAALVGGLVLAYNKLEWFRNGVDKLWNGIKRIFGAGEKTIDDSTKKTAKAINDNLSMADFDTERFKSNMQNQLESPAKKAGESIGNALSGKISEKIAVVKDAFSAAKERIEEYRNAGNYLATEEIKMWQNLSNSYEKSSKERIEIDKNVARLQEQINRDSFNKSKAWIETRKFFNILSLDEEIAAWERVQSRYLEGTAEREEADRNLFAAQQKLAQERQSIIDQMEAAEEKYTKAIESRASTIYKSFGLFDELKKKDSASAYELTKNLKSQVEALGQWSNNIASLAARGISEGFIAELRDMGPTASAEIAALSSMTDKELSAYQELWAEKHRLATEQAIGELEPLRKETDKEILGLMEQLENGITQTAENTGKNLISGILDGMKEKSAELLEYGKTLGATLLSGFSALNKSINLDASLNLNTSNIDELAQNAIPNSAAIPASSITSISPQNVNNAKLSDIVLAGLQDGFAMVSDTILDALPEIVQIYIDSGKVAESTFKALEESATRRNRMFAPTREQITAVARSAMPSFT